MDIDHLINWVQFYEERLPTTPKPAGDHKYNACCPFHSERNPSFWFNTTNGLWKCESGCGSGNATSFLEKLEGISGAEAWEKLCRIAGVDPRGDAPNAKPRAKAQTKKAATLAEYARDKHLPLDRLEALGLRDCEGNGYTPAHVTIPYYDADGRCAAIKQRFHPQNTQRFGWEKGGRVIPYGVWLDLNKNAKALVLVEGESDAQSLWLHGVPALGVPGATNFQTAWVRPYIGDRDVFLHVEPDNGGQKFREKTLSLLRDAGYTGTARTFSCHEIDPECKDPSDLHIKYGDGFRGKLDPALKAAKREDLSALVIHEAKEIKAPEEKPREIPRLNTYKASDLYGKELKRPPTIVQGMIPVGLTVLAGNPKRGKSWLALLLALCVANGDPFLGMRTTQGDVLYLDLESRQYRVQMRLSKLIPGRAPDALTVTHDSLRLGDGLEEQLNMWCQDAENPRLIIVDTLGRVKSSAKRGENAYEGDTRIMGALQQTALTNNVAIVCVHHLRKTVAESDSFERISGSMGISGACDSVMMLQGKRGEDFTTLSVISRDFENIDLILGFDNGRWHLRSADSDAWREEQAYQNGPYTRAIIAMAHKYKIWRGTSSELVEELIKFGASTVEMEPRKVTGAVLAIREKLNDRDGVLVVPPKKGPKGRRIMEVMEVQKDGF